MIFFENYQQLWNHFLFCSVFKYIQNNSYIKFINFIFSYTSQIDFRLFGSLRMTFRVEIQQSLSATKSSHKSEENRKYQKFLFSISRSKSDSQNKKMFLSIWVFVVQIFAIVCKHLCETNFPTCSKKSPKISRDIFRVVYNKLAQLWN